MPPTDRPKPDLTKPTSRAGLVGRFPILSSKRSRRTAAFAKLRRALVLRLCIARKRGRDVGFRLRQAYGATSWAESGFRLPIYVAAAPGGGPTVPH